ncbi:hypothetical protein NLU13_5665 [Sarocladium strictum]|uniref:Exonuclease domain-containing protein n=1 Tax=Sarocladium strictum TaxID=5046 RepID=A0AA39GHB7_SARSR|nr:hypothetical protein NLU13_5665 [Sarocladium strictum]
MSLSLKHVPCPAGNKCTAFHCIFGHEREKTKSEAAPALEKEKSNKSLAAPQDGPRKRPRLESTGAVSPASADGLKKQRLTDSNGTEEQLKGTLATADRPISPPPLRKGKPVQTPLSSAKQTPAISASSKSSLTAASEKVRRPQASTSSSQPKKESLNPRLIKSGAPASHEVRLKLIKMLHQQLERLDSELKKDAKDDEQIFLMTSQELVTRALDEEQQIATEKPAIYSNLMKNKVMQFKRMNVGQWRDLRLKETKQKGSEAQKGVGQTGADKPVEIETGLTPSQEVQILRRLLTPIDALTEHGYVASIPTDEAIEKSRQGVEASQGWEKCDRCQQRFQVFPGRRSEDGALTSGGTCVFHWGKSYVPSKAQGDKTRKAKRYHCCGEEVGDSAGCFKKDHHVFKASDPKRLASILNFEKTPENLSALPDRAVCFDCEMAYTVYGMELIRLTATSWPTGEELLDVLVKPIGEILDLNSRFSGVWPEDMATAKPWSPGDALVPAKNIKQKSNEDGVAKPNSRGDIKIVSSPAAARELLFSLISPSTPLVGHGLENDLNAVRIIHPTLVDTILLYPHKGGLPFRYGLKHLMETQLNKKIQQDGVGAEVLGHDSAEDARAAGELARLKVMKTWKDMRWEGWKVEGDKLVQPEAWNPDNWTLTTEFIEK